MFAHKLTKQVRTSFVCGRMDVPTISYEVFCDQGETNILNEFGEPSEI